MGWCAVLAAEWKNLPGKKLRCSVHADRLVLYLYQMVNRVSPKFNLSTPAVYCCKVVHVRAFVQLYLTPLFAALETYKVLSLYGMHGEWSVSKRLAGIFTRFI